MEHEAGEVCGPRRTALSTAGTTAHDAAPAFRRICVACAAGLLALLIVAFAVPLAGFELQHVGPSFLLFWSQDILILPILITLLLVAPLMVRESRQARAIPDATLAWLAVGTAVVLCLVGWAGNKIVFEGYDLSRDEQMATFDAAIFARGHISWPIASAWRPFAEALNQLFILPIGRHEAWVSAYLPVNAMLRAAVGGVADAAATGPILVGIGALALWRIAVRLWPNSPPSQLVVLILYAGSTQIVLTSMTAYAMSAHLALDLVWLALFLRGGSAGHAGAIAVGFLATGLHQPIFHPLFVLPFLDLLRRQRRWRLLAVYVAAYAAIGAFWLAWPHWLTSQAATPSSADGGAGYLQRLLGILHVFDARALWLMTLNLLRFAGWQHLLLLPLAVSGLTLAQRDPMVRALAIGLALPVLIVALILPLQGHGWGYRYLHGVLGNACLLGGYGWHRFASNGLDLRRPFAAATVATLAVVMPASALFAHRWVEPYAAAVRAMSATHADIVVVDNAAVPWGQDLVVNRPDLSNRPIRLLASAIEPRDMADLCRHGSLAFFGKETLRPINERLGMSEEPKGDAFAALEAAARRSSACTIIKPPS